MREHLYLALMPKHMQDIAHEFPLGEAVNLPIGQRYVIGIADVKCKHGEGALICSVVNPYINPTGVLGAETSTVCVHTARTCRVLNG